MDTKLKKFNLSAFLKFIAVVLCLLCVGVSVCQLSSVLITAEKSSLGAESFYDAVYYGTGKEIWETNSFKNEYGFYAAKLVDLIAFYGDGSENYFNLKNEVREKENAEKFERARKNLITEIEQKEGFDDYLIYLSTGDIVNCGYLKTQDDLSGDEYSYNEIEEGEISYQELVSPYYSDYVSIYQPELTREAQKLFEETKADGVVFISSSYSVYDFDTDDTVGNYPAGYYFFKVNDNALAAHLIDHNALSYSTQTYEQFKKEYDYEQEYLKENFPSARYFIRDAEGRTYTNIKSLNKKSSEDDINGAMSKYGFYTRTDLETGSALLSDGKYYTDYLHSSIYESDIFATGKGVKYTDEIPGIYTTGVTETTTTLPAVPVPTTQMPTAETPEDVTVHTTTYTQTYISPVFSYEEKGTPDIYIGVDMNSESYKKEECRFSQVKDKIVLARDMAKDTIRICGALAIVFLLLFIFLIAFSGRRFGDRENVYMLPGDRMFTDLRFLLDCGLGFLNVLLIIGVLDEFFANGNVNELVILLLGGVCALFALIVLDLVLFITRHIKNRSLIKNVSLIWCIKKLSEKSGKVLKADSGSKLLNVLLALFIPVNAFIVFLIWGVCNNEGELVLCMTAITSYDLITLYLLFKQKNWLSPVKEKMQYVKGFSKEAAIKGAIVLGVNLVLGLLAIFEIVNVESLWLTFMLIGFDIFVAVQLVRFIAGVKKIFSAVNELKEGNYDVQINLFAIPRSLHGPANKLMSLRDGLKTAVEEAVKQEQTKTELITNVSHDLKTPLTSIINYVELLKKCDITDENAKEYLSVLGEKSDRLKKLIEDLVEASKASTGNLKVELMEVSLNEITKQITGEFSDNFEGRSLTLVETIPQEDITVRADSKMLYRVLENLMGNVSKYAMENTRVYLSVERRDGKGVISVKNISGSPLNITAEQLKARFVRGDEARSTDGNGLGLSIAESLCTLQGGKLNIEINGDLFVAEVVI